MKNFTATSFLALLTSLLFAACAPITVNIIIGGTPTIVLPSATLLPLAGVPGTATMLPPTGTPTITSTSTPTQTPTNIPTRTNTPTLIPTEEPNLSVAGFKIYKYASVNESDVVNGINSLSSCPQQSVQWAKQYVSKIRLVYVEPFQSNTVYFPYPMLQDDQLSSDQKRYAVMYAIFAYARLQEQAQDGVRFGNFLRYIQDANEIARQTIDSCGEGDPHSWQNVLARTYMVMALNKHDIFQPATSLTFNARPTLIGVPNKTATPMPHDIVFSDTLTTEEKRMLMDALEHLRNCMPTLYNYVRSHVDLVTRGARQVPNDTIGYVLTGESTIYLPQGTILGDNTYLDSARTFLTAANLVHEARHIELGEATTEQDAYLFELQVFTPQCYPNDVAPDVFARYRQDIEKRAGK